MTLLELNEIIEQLVVIPQTKGIWVTAETADLSRVAPGEGSGQGVIPTPIGDTPLLLLLLFAPAYILHFRRHAKHA